MGEERPSVYSQRAAYQVPGSQGTSLPQDSHSQLTVGNVWLPTFDHSWPRFQWSNERCESTFQCLLEAARGGATHTVLSSTKLVWFFSRRVTLQLECVAPSDLMLVSCPGVLSLHWDPLREEPRLSMLLCPFPSTSERPAWDLGTHERVAGYCPKLCKLLLNFTPALPQAVCVTGYVVVSQRRAQNSQITAVQ